MLMYCKNKASWLSVNSNGVTDNVKLCAEHARILHKAIPCHKAYQVPPYVSLMEVRVVQRRGGTPVVQKLPDFVLSRLPCPLHNQASKVDHVPYERVQL